MLLKIFTLLITLLLPCSWVSAEYLSLVSGLQYGQHGYLTDAGTLNTQVYGAKLDLSDWRRQQKGWLSRGFSAEYLQGENYSQIKGRLPLYHWHKHQGLWLEIKQLSQNMEVVLSADETLLSDSGQTTSLLTGTKISAGQLINQYDLFWYEAISYKAPVNLIGLFYYSEASPASSTINGSSATIFDGVFTGIGLILGRIKDDRGLNFQWRLNLAKLDMSFSDSVTNHRAASKSESTAYKLGLDLSWHYRYYLSPYWYLVPEVKLGLNMLTQTQFEPVEIEYRPFVFIESAAWLSLQKRF